MKYLSFLFTLAFLIFVGCTEISSEVSRDLLQPMTFSASVLDEPDVKAAVDGLDIKWSAGDRIGIYDGTSFREFTLKEGAGTTSAIFEGEAAQANSYTAVYPYSEDLSIDSEGKITGLSVPRFQIAGECPVIMTAECGDGGNSFTFRSALAYVRFTPEFDCHKIVLETYGKDSGPDLCGDVEIVSDSARVNGNPCNHVILSGEIVSGNSYYIGVAPKRLDKGFKIIFDDAVNPGDILDNGLQYARKSNKTPDLLRGHVLNLGRFGKESTEWTENGVDLVSFEMDGQDTERFDDRAVYDWKDFKRIAARCEKTDTLKTSRVYILEDIDFGGAVIYPELFHIKGASLFLYGNGHKIGNYIQGGLTDEERGRAGLFYVKTLKNFCVEDLNLYPKQFHVTGSGGISYGGAFAASIYCTENVIFRNCSVHGDISLECTGDYLVSAGGFVGIVETLGFPGMTNVTQPAVCIENCLMEGSVYAYSKDDEAYAGGFFGSVAVPVYDYICSITRCRNRADITAIGNDDIFPFFWGVEATAAGGMVGCGRDTGQDLALRLNSCVNEGTVIASALDNDNAFAGGMIGLNDSDGEHVDDDVNPYVHNCLNRGAITAISDDAKAGGMVGYCYDDDTTFCNCVNDGEISSGDVGAHISGSEGAYDSRYPCYWTKNDGRYGIYDNEDTDGYRVIIRLDALNAANYGTMWIMRDGHIDLDIIR